MIIPNTNLFLAVAGKVAGGWVEVVGGEDDGDGNIPTHPQYPRYEDTKQ